MADDPSSPGNASSATANAGDRRRERARRHEALANIFCLLDLLLTAVLLAVFLGTGASAALARWSEGVAGPAWLARALYLAATTAAYMIGFLLPYEFATDYLLDRRYGLTRQSAAGWLGDFGKHTVLALVQMLVALEIVYFCLDLAGGWWWLAAGIAWFVLGMVLTQIYPVLILPLFHRGERIGGGELVARLEAMARRAGVRLAGVYRLVLSDKTSRVNAAFAGLGPTRRILLGDTLLDRFSHDEIEAVMAHEMGHDRHRDLWRLLAVNGACGFGAFLLADALLRWVVAIPRLGVRGINDIAGLPALLLALGAAFVGLMPATHAYSRRRERAADDFALEVTGNPEAFIGAMRRLADQNLADPEPHPLVEFLMHTHPSIGRRIRRAEAWRVVAGVGR